MHAMLATCGLLLIASILTLVVTAERSWFVSVARGIGVQGLIGLVISAFLLFFPAGNGPVTPTVAQAPAAVQGVVYHAGGWSAGALYNNLKPGTQPDQHLDAYLPIVGAQILLIAMLLAWRKMRDETVFDATSCLLIMLVLANSLVSVVMTFWWTL